MPIGLLRRSFDAFHVILGLGILWLSARTAVLALRPGGHHNPHAAALGAAEAIGALLFLFPRTLRVGAILLLLSIGIAAVVHAFSRELRIDLLIYAAGVGLVAVRGADLPRRGTGPTEHSSA